MQERNTKLFHNQSQVLFYGNWRSSDWLPALIHEPKSEVSRDNQGTYMKQELPSGEACWGKDPHSCRRKYVHSSYKLTYIFTHKYGQPIHNHQIFEEDQQKKEKDQEEQTDQMALEKTEIVQETKENSKIKTSNFNQCPQRQNGYYIHNTRTGCHGKTSYQGTRKILGK